MSIVLRILALIVEIGALDDAAKQNYHMAYLLMCVTAILLWLAFL